VLRADAPTSVKAVTLVVDGRTVATVGPPFEKVLRLSRGKHEVWAEAGSMKSRRVSFEVR